ncbi:fumarylacetoacetate hydrolase family protein [Arthrobacter sp. ISL-72]|uniref:fumarylacetoacetate hydrolase family protein n=1 Tax=Arthrobacter sp. ISL-72 TaxID=2819114 RepID=UPI001BE89D14|nr:fumarylacetoacetate hydrolase family protein [Arthrobacter sp. ISL-72]MBT2596717.1 fumarylacetoacetate hydrolase family protein [Arthrobacter sp. ISL-72]
MKFARLGDPGREQPAVQPGGPEADGKWFSLDGITADIDGRFLENDGVARVREALAAGILAEIVDATGLRAGAPLARPGAVIGIGLNYAGHAAESGAAVPEVPVVFLKPSNTVAGPFDDAPIPPLSRKYDWEVELAVVIGRRASYLTSAEEAADCVAGYVLANDLSERDYQLPGAAGQWVKGKSLPASTPIGPWFVPASELDPSALRLRSWVNGELRQDSSTADLIFDVPAVVHHLSQFMVLEPGDVVLTGTPEGVALSGRFPYLEDGDVLELEVEGLGRQRQLLRRATAP